MGTINAYNYVFPVVSGTLPEGAPGLLLSDIYGTAFCLGNGFYMTSAHVLRGALDQRTIHLAYTDGSVWEAIQASDHEVLEGYDIAIIAARVPTAEAMPWSLAEEVMGQDVQTVGFPYAFQRAPLSIQIRSFKGHVVSSRTFMHLPDRPRIYELSFQCPRGLSGAPLFTIEAPLRIRGIICGNAATEMLVFTDRERIDDGTVKIIERYESLQLGIAIQARSLGAVYSRLLKRTITEHLKELGILAQ